MVGWMPYWSHRSETGVRSRRWSRRMAAFSWALGRFRVFLGMGKPPLEIVAYSSGPFFPFRLKQNSFGLGRVPELLGPFDPAVELFDEGLHQARASRQPRAAITRIIHAGLIVGQV